MFLLITVPVHKVEDITHVNFTDRDHLWFDPNCKNSTSLGSNPANGSITGSGNSNSITNNNSNGLCEHDPMATMLENNAKNTNAANIFVNKLHGLVSEYAEVSHANVIENPASAVVTSNGPYATTNLVDPSNVSLILTFLASTLKIFQKKTKPIFSQSFYALKKLAALSQRRNFSGARSIFFKTSRSKGFERRSIFCSF